MKLSNLFTCAFLLALAILLSTCGLSSYAYIFSPTVPSSATGSSKGIVVRNNDENNADIFQGYEIYYKFYLTSSSTSAMANDDKALFDKEEPEPADITRLGFRRVETTGFYRKNNIVQKTPTPMIVVEYSSRTDPFTFLIDFSDVDAGSTETIPSVTSSGNLANEGVELFRPIIDTDADDYTSENQPLKSFISDDFSTLDSDMTGFSRVTLSLYIFAYGKHERVYNIYSKPVWLGFIDYSGEVD